MVAITLACFVHAHEDEVAAGGGNEFTQAREKERRLRTLH